MSNEVMTSVSWLEHRTCMDRDEIMITIESLLAKGFLRLMTERDRKEGIFYIPEGRTDCLPCMELMGPPMVDNSE